MWSMMAPATLASSRGRPRKYSTDAARAQARRIKVRQYVQAHRERRKQRQASPDADTGQVASGDDGHFEHHQTAWAIDQCSSKAYSRPSVTLPHSATTTDDGGVLAPRTADSKTCPCCNSRSTTNDTSFEHVHQHKSVNVPKRLQSAESISPVTILSASRSDPFESACSGLSMQPYDYEMLDHSVTYQWTKFSCSTTEAAITAIKSDITKAAMSNRASFYATLFAGSTHLAYRRIRAGLSVEDRAQARRLIYKVKAIEALRGEIALQQNHSEIDGLRLDSTVMCVLTLAAHGTGEDIVQQARQNLASSDVEPTHFLATVQDVDYYSAMNCELQHWRIIEALVQRRGGLAAIQISGLASAIGLYDVFMARRTLSQPKFPVLMSSAHAMSALSSMLPPHTTTTPQCSGFDEILSEELGDLRDSLLNVLHNLRTITAALDVFDGMMKLPTPSKRDADTRQKLLTAILWTRHLVQHALLSLPRQYPGPERPEPKVRCGKRLYELAHLTALVYCEMVVSPILGAHEMRSALCDRLRRQLRWWHESGRGHGATRRFVGWATLLCAMYCGGQRDRSEAVTFLKSTLSAMAPETSNGMAGWADAKLCLGVERFLWSSRFMDVKARRLWEEFMTDT